MNEDNSNPDPTTPDAMREDVDAHANAHPALAPEAIVLGDHSFTVRPMKTRQVFPFMKLARPLLAALSQRPSSPQPGLPPTEAGQGQGGSTSDQQYVDAEVARAMEDAGWMLAVLDDHGPSIIKGLAIALEPECLNATKLKAMEERILDLEAIDTIVLIKHFVVVNAGFFAARGLTLPASLPGLPGVVAGASALRSQASS